VARLSDEQRAALQKQLDDDDAAAAAESDDGDDWYDLQSGDNSFRVRAGSKAGKRAHSWVKEHFGIDLDDEPAQDPDAGEDADPAPRGGRKPAAAPADPPPGQVRAFGRRVS